MNIPNHITPYYIINKDLLVENLEKLRWALDSNWGNYIIGYSYKTNTLPCIIEFFRDNNCYAEVVSDDEYCLAKHINYNDNRIIYNGVAKSKSTFINAVSKKSIVNIDADYEIDWLEEIENPEVGIRVNFDLEAMCPGHSQCGTSGDRFGFCFENGELKRAIEEVQGAGGKVIGLHLHKSSITRLPEVYEAIAKVAVEVTKEYRLDIKYIDIGGGFFGGLEGKPDFNEYFNRVRDVLSQAFSPEKVTLIVEPGMALIGSVIDYVTSVIDIKKTNRNIFVITDGSRMQVDPLMRKTSYFYDLIRAGNIKRCKEKNQVIVGYTCMENDRLFELENEYQLVKGDRIVYHKVGAYTMCLSPLFIKWFPDVYMCSKGKLEKVRRRWNTNDYMKQYSENK